MRWTYFHLYVLLDVFSRYVVGWMVAPRESATLAERLIRETCERHGVERDQLTLHADRGTSMRSKLVAELLADLDVTKTHSRPDVSNGNPFSEAGFKTLKYRPDFQARFGSLEDARAYCVDFFAWYNAEHYDSGIGLQTPEAVHYGRAHAVVAEGAAVLALAHAAHPERFVRGGPRPHAAAYRGLDQQADHRSEQGGPPREASGPDGLVAKPRRLARGPHRAVTRLRAARRSGRAEPRAGRTQN